MFTTVAAVLTERRLHQIAYDETPSRISNLAWAFAEGRQPDEQLFGALARLVQQYAGGFDAQQITNAAMAFSTARFEDLQLYTSLADMAK